jgi:hypothetical protein
VAEYRNPGGAGSSDGPNPSLPLSAGIGSKLQRPGGPRFRSSQDTRPASATTPGTPGTPAAVPAPARTTLPTKQHIRCYECAYEFDLTGRMGTTHCPKCRASLDLAGYTIDAECGETLKTLGKIKITPRGIVNSAQLLGTDVDLAGKVTNSSVEASRELILFPGAEFTRGNFKAVDLKLEAGGETIFRNPALYRNVDVIGTLTAPLYATGLVTIRASARFTGSICGGRLVVEDGATIDADANVSPEGLAEAEKMKEQMANLQPGANERVVVTAIAPAAAPA